MTQKQRQAAATAQQARIAAQSSASNDPVNPAHYKGDLVMRIIEKFNLGFRTGNCVKYILRAGSRGKLLEDLKKARWYLDREIAILEGETAEGCVE